MPRETLLQERNAGQTQKHQSPPLVLTTKYNPRLKGLAKAMRKHWQSIRTDQECNELPPSPLLAYKRHANIGDFLISSKLPRLNGQQQQHRTTTQEHTENTTTHENN
ncbi:hypothetical protein BaRGS_00040022 [Batillaria attramentaria]|uniref:Uncharacterized protein n=1 Tax=Batillaria attramentaria TaxID=370345 RepID=A0ABD0J1I9_9CAEN